MGIELNKLPKMMYKFNASYQENTRYIQLESRLVSSHLQDDVAIAHVKFSMFRFWQWNWLKILDSPDFSAPGYC